jgi:methyltransferase (TIGR00027 family)
LDMKEGKPSTTAHRVAIRRAAHQVLDDPRVLDDPIALPILGAEASARIAAERERPQPPGSQYIRAFMVVRSRLAEDELARAIERGASQYVILGAGLDTFAYRNPHQASRLRVFEVDHPATQAWKRARLVESGIAEPQSLTFAPVDFEKQSLSEGLAAARFERSHLTFFSWLGVTPYLTREAMLATVGFIAGMPPGSGVVFDYGVPRDSLGWMGRWAFDKLARRVSAAGEPFRLFFDPAALEAQLKAAGFSHCQDWDSEKLNQRYFAGRRDKLRVRGDLGRIMCARV